MRHTFTWHDQRITNELREDAMRGLTDAANHLLEEANRTVPLDEGTLKRSGVVSTDPSTLRAAVSYDTPYARRLHEHPEYRFQGRGRGKWLLLTLQERADAIRDYIKAKLFRR